jgi:hypothetical protein
MSILFHRGRVAVFLRGRVEHSLAQEEVEPAAAPFDYNHRCRGPRGNLIWDVAYGQVPEQGSGGSSDYDQILALRLASIVSTTSVSSTIRCSTRS